MINNHVLTISYNRRKQFKDNFVSVLWYWKVLSPKTTTQSSARDIKGTGYWLTLIVLNLLTIKIYISKFKFQKGPYVVTSYFRIEIYVSIYLLPSLRQDRWLSKFRAYVFLNGQAHHFNILLTPITLANLIDLSLIVGRVSSFEVYL